MFVPSSMAQLTSALDPVASRSQATGSPTLQPGAHNKIDATAREFESILLGQWLQSAQTSFSAVPGSDEDQDQGGEQMKSFALQQLAKSLSDAGGIGIGNLVSKALTHAQERDSCTMTVPVSR